MTDDTNNTMLLTEWAVFDNDNGWIYSSHMTEQAAWDELMKLTITEGADEDRFDVRELSYHE